MVTDDERMRTHRLQDLNVTLAAPVQVAKRRNLRLHTSAEDRTGQFLWYPQLARLSDGELLVRIRLGGDSWEANVFGSIGFSWSADGGQSWSDLLVTSRHNGYGSLTLPSGDLLILPFMPAPAPHGMIGPCNLIPRGKREVRFIDNAVEITGFLRNTTTDSTMGVERESFTVVGFFFDGRPIMTSRGWLTTLYGVYAGDPRPTLHAASSPDGFKWTIRATIAALDSGIGHHNWGNSEAEICRLPNNRLMCVYRLQDEPCGQSFSVVRAAIEKTVPHL